jgi:peptide/nickel transport system permease protein
VTRTLPIFVLRRLLGAIAFVVVVSSSALMLIRLAPGDATTDMRLRVSDSSVIIAEQARLGLDRPAWVQLGSWLSGLVRFDLGTSSKYGRPVSGLVAARVGNTAILAGLALVIATLAGIPLGVITGTHARAGSRTIAFVSILLVACPPILFSLALLYVAVVSGWLSNAPGSLALPLLALALPMAAVIERLQSRATAETAGLPSLAAAAARGVPRTRLVWVHGLRPSLQSVLGVYGIIIAALFSGSVAVESITSWPGLGLLLLDGLKSRDVYLVAGCAMAGALLVALGNLLADVLRAVVDPSVREAA